LSQTTTTANNFIVLELNCSVLHHLGTPIMAQDAPESKSTENKQVIKSLQMFGGISTILPGLMHQTHGMKRDTDGTFLELVEPATAPKKSKGDCGCCTASGSSLCPPKTPSEQGKKAKKVALPPTTPPAKDKKKWFSRKVKA
jgi:hypothetical protein